MNDTDDRLVEAMREYQAALDAGRAPLKREFLSRYPDIASELSECLGGLDFLRSAAPGLRPPDPGVMYEGTLGDFRLLREIGRGGMGVVYEAEQISLGRRVALKILPLAGTLDARQLARFENEARAAAALHHGNIVPVFAVGRERGVPYYAMQLIDGRTLADVIEGLRADARPEAPAADTVANAVSITRRSAGSAAFYRSAAEAGVQAAEALEYAHQMGVVHRDIKPANLLLDGDGRLWITDFGLARVQSAPGVTTPGDLVGTLRYMSPEQAAGQPVIDPRGDVYSLGATLYELLARQPAFGGRDRGEVLRQVLEQEPVPPRRLDPTVPAELETVILKAMAKRPEDRYASAKELADDLRRWLDDRPVQARRPGLQQRLAKWAKRHRRLVAAAVACLVVSVLALGVTTWRVSAAEKRAREALRNEVEQRSRAESNFQQARKVLDFVTRVGVEELDDRPEFQPVRRRLLAELLAYYEEFIDQHGADSSVAAELIETRLQVAQLLEEVGKRAEAMAAFEKAMRERPFMPGGPRPPGGPPFRMPRGMVRMFFLSQPSVRQELKLTPAQVEALGPCPEPGLKPRGGEGPLAENAADKVLTKEQGERLRQIILQSRGVEALLDNDVVKALGLSEKQVEEIRPLLGRGAPPGWEGGPPRRPPPDRAMRVLTPEQQGKWKELRGEPFRGELRFFMPPPPRHGPPPHDR